MTPTNGIIELDKILERALREGYDNDSIEILKIDSNFGASKGVNYFSDFSKMTVRYKKSGQKTGTLERVANVVIKREPNNGRSALEIYNLHDLFGTEWKMYRDILPKIEEKIEEKICPKFLYGSDDLKILVMEDISKEGYKMLDVSEGLSLKHCLMAITKLATLHGGSVAIYEKNPELVKSIKGRVISPESPTSFFRLIEVTLRNISCEIRNWSGDGYLECSEKLEKLAGRIKDRVIKDYDYDCNEFCVINHGDCWINNMMFKDFGGEGPRDVLLVDYQMSVYTSPAIDLHYFLNICPETRLKCDKDDFFLDAYLNTLTIVMRTIGCVTKAPTLRELKSAMHKRRTYAILAGLILFPRMIAHKEDMEEFDEVLGRLNGDTRMNIFKREEAVKAMRKMIIAMNERGYFD